MLDCHITTDNTPSETIGGFTHLAGETVTALFDGFVADVLVAQDGLITLPTAAKQVIVGIRYKAIIEVPDVEIKTKNGTIQGQYKHLSKIGLRLQNSYGGKIGNNAQLMDDIVYETDGRLFDGELEQVIPGGRNKKGRLLIEHNDPYPFYLQAVILKVSL